MHVIVLATQTYLGVCRDKGIKKRFPAKIGASKISGRQARLPGMRHPLARLQADLEILHAANRQRASLPIQIASDVQLAELLVSGMRCVRSRAIDPSLSQSAQFFV